MATVPVNVVFTNLSANASSYKWDLGDGYTTTEAQPSHLYANAGIYVVRLWATGPGGTALQERAVVIQAGQLATFLASSALDVLTDNSGNELIVN